MSNPNITYNNHHDKPHTESTNKNNPKDPSMVNTQIPPPDITSTLISLAGNILEWYDFAVFGYFSDVIGKVFFPPNQKGSASLVESFIVYGLAFVVRPIGGAVIGSMGDTSGRKGALENSTFWMAFATFMIGCLPTYEMVGPLSPVLLAIMRMVQGMSVAGQFSSLFLFTLEQRDFSTWGYWGAVVNAFSKIGGFIGSALTLTIRNCLTEDQVKQWGWRIPFWLGAAGALPAIYLKLNVEEYYVRPSMQRTNTDHVIANNDCENGDVRENNPVETMEEIDPVKEVLSRANFPSLIGASLIPSLYCTANYFICVWFVIFMNAISNPPIPHAYSINTINVLLGGILLTVIAGWFADWYGDHKKVMIVSCIMCAVTAPLAFSLVGKGGAYVGLVAFSVQLYLSILLAIFSAAMIPWLVSHTPVETRLTMISIGLNTCSLLFSGFTPLVATILANQINFIAPAFMLTTTAGVSLVGTFILYKRQGGSRMTIIDGGNVPLLQ